MKKNPQNGIHIDDLITKLGSFKVVLEPSREKYRDYVFEVACREMELNGYNPAKDTQSLGIFMRRYIGEDIEYADNCYQFDTGIHRLVVPDKSHIEEYLMVKYDAIPIARTIERGDA